MALLRAGNPAAAIAQIKVAPGVRELRALEKALAAARLAGRWHDVDVAITESLQALAAPRLHRSP
jgi:dihydroorotase-like cyclic amidohydrolase